MCEQRTGLASPPDSRSRRQFLRTVGVAGVSIVAAGRTAAGDGPPPDGNAGTLAKVTSQTDRALWRFETGDWVSASPTVIDGTVYVGSDDAHLYALDAATGSQEWRYETATPVDRAPAVRPEAQSQFEGAGVFFGDHKHFYAVDGSQPTV